MSATALLEAPSLSENSSPVGTDLRVGSTTPEPTYTVETLACPSCDPETGAVMEADLWDVRAGRTTRHTCATCGYSEMRRGQW